MQQVGRARHEIAKDDHVKDRRAAPLDLRSCKGTREVDETQFLDEGDGDV